MQITIPNHPHTDRTAAFNRAMGEFKHQSKDIVRECRQRAAYENKRDKTKRKRKEADFQRKEARNRQRKP